ncbi:MAG TPA: flavodoxin domain-containing protein [Thermotogota bacterium]|nr:flavodoxin domain-containing protein [Thermotogota bacterium]HPJ90084.1 flavodoxin domain-containing protein [Thermotogota bacterium]HPR97278.1 flavodoxin domain-containing protein [Thermotogota bacterium]
MKYAILYATKAGGTENSARILKEKLIFEHQIEDKDIEILNLSENTLPNLESYDKIVVGTGIYMGKPNKKVISFLEKNRNSLMNKRLSLYICALSESEDEQKRFLEGFPEDILKHAEPIAFFGGAVIYKKLNCLTAFMMKRITKSKKDVHKLKYEVIKGFADKISE